MSRIPESVQDTPADVQEGQDVLAQHGYRREPTDSPIKLWVPHGQVVDLSPDPVPLASINPRDAESYLKRSS